MTPEAAIVKLISLPDDDHVCRVGTEIGGFVDVDKMQLIALLRDCSGYKDITILVIPRVRGLDLPTGVYVYSCR